MRRGHETWLHVLVVVALVMGLAFAMLGWNWLPVAFPATGVLFAAGGAACAAGLDRADGAWAFLRQAGLRLLLPFWLFAAVVVPFMVDHGWRADADLGSAPLTWDTGWLWLLPLADPPVSTDGLEWTPGLSFARTFLWLVLLSPALVWLFRRWPLRLSAIPVVTLALVGTGLISLEGRAYDQVVPICLWSCCWLLGVAWTDRSVHRAPLVRTLAVGGALTAAGVWWAVLLQQRAEGDLYDSPLATLLFSTGAVLLLLRAGSALPRVDGLSRTGRGDRVPAPADDHGHPVDAGGRRPDARRAGAHAARLPGRSWSAGHAARVRDGGGVAPTGRGGARRAGGRAPAEVPPPAFGGRGGTRCRATWCRSRRLPNRSAPNPSQ